MNEKLLLEKLSAYVNASADLAESVRDDIKHNNGVITDETVLALNQLIISSHEVAAITNALQPNKVRLN
jgi:transketolase